MAIQFAARHRFTVADYYRMAEVGVLREDDRVELVEGEIVRMTPAGSRHAGCVKRLVALLTSRIGGRAVVSVQDPLALGDLSVPEPDVAVLKPREDFYAESHPQAADVLLLIEVADSSLAYDRDEKGPLYARHGIAEYWLVDLTQSLVLVHTAPSASGYGHVETKRRGDDWTAIELPELSLSGTDILG